MSSIFQLKTQRIYKESKSQPITLTFEGATQIYGYICGVTGFYFTYEQDPHDISTIKADFYNISYNGNQITFNVDLLMEDNYHPRNVFTDESYIEIAVLAQVVSAGESSNAIACDSVRAVPNGVQETTLPPAQFTQQAMVQGFNFSYGSNHDNRVQELKTYVYTQADSKDNNKVDIVSDAKLEPNDNATTYTDVGVLSLDDSNTTVKIITQRLQSTNPQTIPCGSRDQEAPKNYGWAMFLQGFKFKYGDGKHHVKNVQIDSAYKVSAEGEITWHAKAIWNCLGFSTEQQEDYSEDNPDGSCCDVVFIGWPLN